VTEWEAKAALLNECDQACSRFFWLHCEFKGGVPDTAGRHWDFYDGHGNASKAGHLAALKQWMREVIPPERVVDFSDASFESFVKEDEAWQGQLGAWEKKAEEVLGGSLQEVVAQKQAWDEDGAGLGVPGSEAAEMLHHAKWAAIKVMDFVGREDLVERGIASITAPTAPAEETNFSGISLCIVGASGSGKTALCAKLADSLYQWQQALPATAEDAEVLRNRPVKIVFCGTSSESFNALNMLRSVCRHISLVLDKPVQDCLDILKMDYDTVVKYFYGYVRDYPVVVLFDSLDQLSNAHLARSDISFLKGIRPHRLSRIIVSTLPDDLKQGNKFKIL